MKLGPEAPPHCCRILRVEGVVQGVGLRPRVYALATARGLTGWVRNRPDGVEIRVEGAPSACDAFESELTRCAPPIDVRVSARRELRGRAHARFEILASVKSSSKETPASSLGRGVSSAAASCGSPSPLESPSPLGSPSPLESRRPLETRLRGLRRDDIGACETLRWNLAPDLGICSQCLAELFTPTDRRYRYPFISCATCGPRYTILHGLPYDRERTVMRGFALCGACEADYRDPASRRFHAETLACFDCGPRLAWIDGSGRRLEDRECAPLERAIEVLEGGGILAVQGIGGFQLLTRACEPAAVQRLRARKSRPEKPLALLMQTLGDVRRHCIVSDREAALLMSPAAPIVLLRRVVRNSGAEGPPTADAVAPGLAELGVMLPTSGLHALLAAGVGEPLVATSGNRAGEPICISAEAALSRLRGIADGFLVHDRPVLRPCDDSVVRMTRHGPVLLRRARGYAPSEFRLAASSPVMRLALGGHQKAALAIALGERCWAGPHLGDMDDLLTERELERSVGELAPLLDARPRELVHDLHPGYRTSELAKTWSEHGSTRARAVPHHAAHVYALAVEHGLEIAPNHPVLGVAWDGFGYGADGSLWGGEFLRIDGVRDSRLASFRSFRLPGGHSVSREPRRAALGLLFELGGLAQVERIAGRWTSGFALGDYAVMCRSLELGVNAVHTTSVGRLFDAVASLLDLCQLASYEGQAAMRLEQCAMQHAASSAAWSWSLEPRAPGDSVASAAAAQDVPTLELDWRPLLRKILMNRSDGRELAGIAADFHAAMCDAVLAVAARADIRRVLLSGGCFQNRLLLEGCIDRLSAAGFEPYWHRSLPANDGAIAVGQLGACAIRDAHAATGFGALRVELRRELREA